ncbi:xanthine dehydrogenase family protein molybdopterin-binding subunit [Paraburkholderia phenazinium]|uniref:Xanthine dehydrogenase, molybdenum binding subunit apoprotein n=1 Tax=Paraburkholderia phenazinium TaxID=60549 RepID=A0A1N6KQ07_9BURK|nr:xanthine dehydrogenase family protein molybdopterin-binding subunit [Paraburkholderia phenazinium]SIO58682.1 xanthine dehydrogenase, molybdenum binding subunit apoprotein [Paraburkholderia phenazinium]
MQLASNKTQPMIGGDFTRIDGPLKVSGTATYTSDFNLPGMLYAVPVCATIAKGRITRLDTAAAAGMPGVRAVFTRENIGKFYRVGFAVDTRIDEKRPPFDDDNIYYYGQYIGVVVADTFEQASAAVRAVKVAYASSRPDVRSEMSAEQTPSVDTQRGDADSAFAAAPDAQKLDQTYTTPIETHNPIELHATVAAFDGTNYTFYETSQSIVNQRLVMAQMLGVSQDQVRVIMKYLGSGFGGKLFPWSHSLLAGAAARNLMRPVKLVVTREMMFHNVGHRTSTQQRMRLSATTDGRFTSLQQDYVYQTARKETRKENCGETTGYLYSSPNLRATAAYARRDVAPSTSMRGPGAVPGLFAIESAVDELAIQLNMDPVRLRLINEPAIDEGLNVPFSSRHLKECLTLGAEQFGWPQRTPAVGSMRRDGLVVGWGVAAGSWAARRLATEIIVELHADATARVSTATQDIGTGTYTILAQMAANLTGIPLERIAVVIGDTRLPPGPLSGGSMVTASLVPAVTQAAQAAIQQLLVAAAQADNSPFNGQPVTELAFERGMVYRKGTSPGAGVPFERILAPAKINMVVGKGHSGASQDDADAAKVSIHSYCAHFIEVTWQPATARLRVSRVVSVIDGGQIINARTARNQIEGAVVMGVGMALFEETHYDTRTGAPINRNLADYVMTTHADAPKIDVTFLDYPDLALNPLGARGVGEIGTAGIAPAITAAVYHATGVRVRNLPVRIEDLLASQVSA